ERRPGRLADRLETLGQEAVPALLRPALDREEEAGGAILARPVDHPRQAGGHLRLKGDRVRMDIAAVRQPAGRAFAVIGEGEKAEDAVLTRAEEGCLAIGLIRPGLPARLQPDPALAERGKAAAAGHVRGGRPALAFLRPPVAEQRL